MENALNLKKVSAPDLGVLSSAPCFDCIPLFRLDCVLLFRLDRHPLFRFDCVPLFRLDCVPLFRFECLPLFWVSQVNEKAVPPSGVPRMLTKEGNVSFGSKSGITSAKPLPGQIQLWKPCGTKIAVRPNQGL